MIKITKSERENTPGKNVWVVIFKFAIFNNLNTHNYLIKFCTKFFRFLSFALVLILVDVFVLVLASETIKNLWQ